jgi:hypothetical protein
LISDTHMPSICKYPPRILGPCWCISTVSPIPDFINISYQMVRFNGSLMHSTVYRELGSSGFKVDEAWEALGIHCKVLIITKQPSWHDHRPPN